MAVADRSITDLEATETGSELRWRETVVEGLSSVSTGTVGSGSFRATAPQRPLKVLLGVKVDVGWRSRPRPRVATGALSDAPL